MSIHADHSGIARGKFAIPTGIPAGVKSVEIIGERGSRGLAQFTGRGEITLEERRRVITVTRYDPLAQTITLLTEGRHIAAVWLWPRSRMASSRKGSTKTPRVAAGAVAMALVCSLRVATRS